MPDHSAAPTRAVTLRLSIRSDLGDVRRATREAREFLAGQGWQDSDLQAVELVLAEACNNAVNYVSPENRELPVQLEIVSEPDRVEFRIHDHTGGFEWPDKIELPDFESERGRGLYLITSLMDDAAYLRGREENVLVLRKRRAEPVRLALTASQPQSIEEYARRLAENELVIKEMVEEISSCYESLSAIFRYTMQHGKIGKIEEFAQRLLRDLLQIVAAEWFIVRLVEKGESRLAVLAVSEEELELEPLELPTGRRPDAPLEIHAALSRQRIWFDPSRIALEDGPLRRHKPNSFGVIHPILLGNELMGTLTVGRSDPLEQSVPRQVKLAFTAGQTNVISTFADFLATQIANARFQEEQLSRRLVSRELEIANNIQRSLLVTSLPELPGFGLAAFCKNAREIGGDFYDVMKIDDNSMMLAVADVMGKGIPAAMFAAMLRTLLRAAPELTHRPAALLSRVNELLFPELSSVDMFITAQLAYVNAAERKIIVASAGHCPLAVATPGGVKTFSPEGMPLGILQDTPFREESVELPEKCRVLLYTDGLTEALNSKREYFGQQRLMDWLQQTTSLSLSAEQLKWELAKTLELHQANTGLNDDQTFLILAG